MEKRRMPSFEQMVYNVVDPCHVFMAIKFHLACRMSSANVKPESEYPIFWKCVFFSNVFDDK